MQFLDKVITFRNPKGRTGLGGRGNLPRWGPNKLAVTIFTRYQNHGPTLILLSPGNGWPITKHTGYHRPQTYFSRISTLNAVYAWTWNIRNAPRYKMEQLPGMAEEADLSASVFNKQGLPVLEVLLVKMVGSEQPIFPQVSLLNPHSIQLIISIGLLKLVVWWVKHIYLQIGAEVWNKVI